MVNSYENIARHEVVINDTVNTPSAAGLSRRAVYIGPATKGTPRDLTRIFSASGVTRTFGLEGVARAAVEHFSSGADQVFVYRTLSTPGVLQGVGDPDGVDGYSITSLEEGGDALSQIRVLYNNLTDELNIFNLDGGLIYQSTAGVVSVDFSLVDVEGSAVAGSTAVGTFGSIGQQVKVATSEATQTFASAGIAGAGLTVEAAAGLNLNLLQWDATDNPYMLQIAANDGTAFEEHLVTGIDAVNGIIEFNIANVAGAFAAAVAGNSYRLVSLVRPILASEVIVNRLGGSSTGGTELKHTKGSSYNGLAPVVSTGGNTFDSSMEEVLPSAMQQFEALWDAGEGLEGEEVDLIIAPGLFLDTPALDGQTVGETALPSTSAGVLMASGLLPAALTDSLVLTTLTGQSQQVNVEFGAAGDQLAMKAALAAAGRRLPKLIIDEAKGVNFGGNLNSGELRRVASVLNWEDGASPTELILHLDAPLSFSVDANDAVVGGLEAAFRVISTDLLFFHRAVEVDGATMHQWYTDTSDADGYLYHEVNPAWRLAFICAALTGDGNFAQGVIGVRPPSNHFSTRQLSRWLGKGPERSATTGFITKNGTGWLGNKWVSGLALNNVYGGVADFDPGLYMRDGLYPTAGNIVVDENGVPVDIGKFLTFTPLWLRQSNVTDDGLGYVANSASLIAGLQAALQPHQPITNKNIAGAAVALTKPAFFSRRRQNIIAGAKGVPITAGPGGELVPAAGPTFARDSSDFTQESSARFLGSLIEALRLKTQVYLGQRMSALALQGLDTAVRVTLAQKQGESEGALEKYQYELDQTSAEARLGLVGISLACKFAAEIQTIRTRASLGAI